MRGTSRHTGRLISESERLSQSVADILTTPLGSRVMRGDYGSLLFDLVDQPANAAGLQRLRAATVDALKKWEPALAVSRVDVSRADSGEFIIHITDGPSGSVIPVFAGGQ